MWCIWSHGKGSMPKLTVQVFGMVALDPLTTAKSEIDRADRSQQSGQGAHVVSRCAATAETGSNPRVSRSVTSPFGLNLFNFFSNGIQCLVPINRDKAWVLVSALVRIGPFHGDPYTIGVIGLLDQAEGLNTHLAGGRHNVGCFKIGFNFSGNTVNDAYCQQIWPRNTLIAVCRDFGTFLTCQPSFALAAFAFNRSAVLAISTMNRLWLPLAVCSTSSTTVTSKVTARPSMAVTLAVTSVHMPTIVGAV